MALPIRTVVRPAILTGLTNGRLPDSALWDTPGLAGGPVIRLVAPAARAWRAVCAAAIAAGHTLKATSTADSYRSYEIQERVFRQRYTTTVLAGRPYRVWNGVKWYQKPGTAPAAVPGTSNHGLGLAVDVGEERDADTGTESMDAATLAWLVANALRFGFSAELEVEPWHWRYYAGDDIPAAVLDYEQGDDDMQLTDKLTAFGQDTTFGGAIATILARTDFLANRVGLVDRLDRILAAASDDADPTVVIDPAVLAELGAVREALAELKSHPVTMAATGTITLTPTSGNG